MGRHTLPTAKARLLLFCISLLDASSATVAGSDDSGVRLQAAMNNPSPEAQAMMADAMAEAAAEVLVDKMMVDIKSFDDMDKNGDGKLAVDEVLILGMFDHGEQKVARNMLNSLYAKVDKDKDGLIDRDEFWDMEVYFEDAQANKGKLGKKGCGPGNMDACSKEDKEGIERFLKMPVNELTTKFHAVEKRFSEGQSKLEEIKQKLNDKYADLVEEVEEKGREATPKFKERNKILQDKLNKVYDKAKKLEDAKKRSGMDLMRVALMTLKGISGKTEL